MSAISIDFNPLERASLIDCNRNYLRVRLLNLEISSENIAMNCGLLLTRLLICSSEVYGRVLEKEKSLYFRTLFYRVP